MTGIHLTAKAVDNGFFLGSLARIKVLQQSDGAIPWYDGGVIDPWNHTEAAMGLTVLGDFAAARHAYGYLKNAQLEDGSWWAQYGAAVPMDESRYTGDGTSEKRIRDTNFCAYVATGIWHYYEVTDDKAFLAAHWPMVEAATNFVLRHQSPEGEIRWAANDPGTPENDALVTGCSSIYKSLGHAYRISSAMAYPRADWLEARARLGHALRHKPERFDRQWETKDHFSMDWYYPILAGVVTGEAAQARLEERWNEFVVDGLGCRCVNNQPWITVAETCELVLALLYMGRREMARELYSWVHQWRDVDGAYWMGYQYEAKTPWPVEKPAWTAGAVVLAADALLGLTSGSTLFLEDLGLEAAE